MQYVDLQPFADFIRQRNLVDERHSPFYVNWVLRFLRSEFDLKSLSKQDLLQCFSEMDLGVDSVGTLRHGLNQCGRRFDFSSYG